MKFFTHPEGIFELNIPLEWYYKNEVFGYPNKPPFSFELYENNCGCFQISVYHKSKKKFSTKLPKQIYNTNNLKFIENELPDKDFKIYLWATVVEDYLFMAKYVCQPNESNRIQIKEEISKVDEVLSTLMCLSEDRRKLAIGFDRYEKFNSSLAASFDLKNKALENRCFVQFIIITANQIDAYLRICIVLKYQLIEKTQEFKIEYLFQKENDKPVMEKKIYDISKKMNIINETQYNELYKLYNLRNKVVHRFIITDIKTLELPQISLEYESLCEEIRLILRNVELEQFNSKIGYYSSKHPHRKYSDNLIKELKSYVNEKHLYSEYFRDI
ncbi:hypothetical protein LUD75_02125 [Epilithonimonas sp. JDS]|uniref:hypothetical protein n=1 Tax=Epilithonimonas sp. JDS TaxID=2902797 RepID=UPI001E3B61AD|nr:hypothetical protein [Epilithonimonas sp. JDS]MCD9853486.1 hypothetical protein [Epilithonimonas sp. JDS]